MTANNTNPQVRRRGTTRSWPRSGRCATLLLRSSTTTLPDRSARIRVRRGAAPAGGEHPIACCGSAVAATIAPVAAARVTREVCESTPLGSGDSVT